MAAESAGAPAQGGNNVPVVKAPLAGVKPVGDLVNLSKRAVDDSEFFNDIPPDELLAAMNDDDEPEDRPRRQRAKPERDVTKPKARKPEPEPEPEEEEEDEPLAAEADEPAEEQEDEFADREAEERAEYKWSPPEGKGTKDAPLTLRDLPEELFVELSVNGEKVTVDLKEAGRGYMRRQAFDQQVSKVKQGLTEAHDIAEKAVSAQEQLKQRLEGTRKSFSEFIRDPKRVLAALFENVTDRRRIVEALVEDHEDAYEELSFAYADMITRENGLAKDGYQTARARRAKERENRRYQREQAALAEERRQVALERQRWHQEQEEKAKTAQESEKTQAAARATFALLKPGLDAGLLALGLKDLTPELDQALQVSIGVTKRINGGRQLTAADVKQAVLRAGAALGLKPGAKRPAPAPANGAPRRQATTPNKQTNGGGTDKWAGVPQNQLVRSMDWLMEG